MNTIGIVTEEVADLPREVVQEYQVELVPTIMHWPELEGVPGSNTFQKMRELEKRGIVSFGKTSQASPEDYLVRFQRQLGRFDAVLCICVSSKLSGCFNSATLAIKLLPISNQGKVYVVDSLNATCGQALIVMQAIEQIQAGKQIDAIQNDLPLFASHVRLYAMLGDPKWLEAHGRLPHAAAKVIRALANMGIRPVLELKKGTIAPAGLKTRAKDRVKTLFRYVQEATQGSDQGDNRFKVAITHGDDLEAAQRLKHMIENRLKNTDVTFINIMNDVIGVPVGPDAIAVAICPY